MKTAILECTSKVSRATAIDAHVRNSYFLKEQFGWDLLFTPDDYKEVWHKKYDRIVVMYGSHYAPIKYMDAFIRKNDSAKVFWITNEYNIGVNSYMLKIPQGFTVISNVEKNTTGQKNVIGFHSLNLNVLMWQTPNPMMEKTHGILYFGTYRPDRERYFREYLHKPVYLSSSPKNLKKFKHAGCNPLWIKKMSWAHRSETLNLFEFSLYIEDVYTHKVYNHLANRFYEALFCNTITMFDINCMNTLSTAGLDVPDVFIVSEYKDLIEKSEKIRAEYGKCLKIQQAWNEGIQEERHRVLMRLREIVET